LDSNRDAVGRYVFIGENVTDLQGS